MCDDLGISDNKIEVFNFTYMGQTVTFLNMKELTDWIAQEVENMDTDESAEMTITIKLMRESDVKNLPEFEGY